MSISVVLITLNEEEKLAECLGSVAWADEKIVVDSGSTDRTVEVARENGAKVFLREFDDFSSQKNFAIENASGDWILSLDADERITAELSEEIREKVKDSVYDGYLIPRSNIIFGRTMRYGGHQGDRHIRLFRKGKGKFVSPIHEKVEIEGSVGTMEGKMIHYSTSSREEYMEKLKLYTDLESEVLVSSGKKIPLYYTLLKPAFTFIRRYFLMRGFLDGKEGFDFYGLSAYYDILKYRKYFELVRKRKSICE